MLDRLTSLLRADRSGPPRTEGAGTVPACAVKGADARPPAATLTPQQTGVRSRLRATERPDVWQLAVLCGRPCRHTNYRLLVNVPEQAEFSVTCERCGRSWWFTLRAQR